MKCDLPDHESLVARQIAFAYNLQGDKARAARCKKCKQWHVYKEKDNDEDRKNPVLNELFGKN